jgi:ornithine cyclodeaminase/alanine dehydrogenase-like protein (mu-crystallin family)
MTALAHFIHFTFSIRTHMKFIDTESTRRALPFDRLIPALREMFVEGCEVPLRHTHSLQAATDGPPQTVLIMPAWQHDRYLGIKTVAIFPGNSERGLPGLFSTYVLYDARTGEPLAQIDGNEITSRRTAAASALAASYLAPPDARSLLVVGCGRVGSLVPEALRVVRPIERVMVWDRDESAASVLAARLRAQDIDATVASDLGRAAGNADIVSCATLATQPVIQGAWLRASNHLDLIGSFTPQMREADDACFVGARLFVDTQEALQKSGDLLGPMSRGVLAAGDVAGTLSELTGGKVQGRTEAHGRTVFKAVGTALEDLAAAMLVFRSCS